MHINADPGLTVPAAPRRDAAPARSAAREQPVSPDAVDTVEISDTAREALRTRAAFTAEDLAPLKTRFSKLLGKERDIVNRLSQLMAKQLIRRGPLDQLKVEIDEDGNAIVGGIADVKAARALEKAINSDKELLNDIVEYQKEEGGLSHDLWKTTGMSLKDYSARIDSLQRLDTPDEPATMEAIALRDQPLHAVDAEFATLISERFAAGNAFLDISGMNNILGDAEGTVNKMMAKVTGAVAQAFKEMNDGIRQDAAQADDAEQYLADSLVDITRLKISVDNTGNISIEGTASRNNAKTDRAAKEIITDLFEEELQANPATGEQHEFTIAASYLLNVYDETFGEGNPLGLGADARTLEATYDHGKIGANVSSPEREAKLAGEIDKQAKAALEDMGVDADDLVIEMNSEGRLVASGLSPDSPEAERVQTALDSLNVRLGGRTLDDAGTNADMLSLDPVTRLRALMTNMDVLRPGGASLLKR